MKKIKRIITATGASMLLLFCSYNAHSQQIKIGVQTWATKNLDVSSFRNGDANPEAKTGAEWNKAVAEEKPAWCYYDFDPANGTKYGKLYNWYAVIDPRGLAPKGWHIPSDKEWTILTDNLGGLTGAGTQMKSVSGWQDNGNGNNSSGFTALPGGLCFDDGSFHSIGANGFWWSSSMHFDEDVWSRNLYYNSGDVNRNFGPKGNGFSVRCIRD